jgi:hypothetical protein
MDVVFVLGSVGLWVAMVLMGPLMQTKAIAFASTCRICGKSWCAARCNLNTCSLKLR